MTRLQSQERISWVLDITVMLTLRRKASQQSSPYAACQTWTSTSLRRPWWFESRLLSVGLGTSTRPGIWNRRAHTQDNKGTQSKKEVIALCENRTHAFPIRTLQTLESYIRTMLVFARHLFVERVDHCTKGAGWFIPYSTATHTATLEKSFNAWFDDRLGLSSVENEDCPQDQHHLIATNYSSHSRDVQR